MRTKFYSVAMSLAMTLGAMGASTEALALGRQVVVNGNLMNATQLAQLDSVHCERIPDGNYFLTQQANGAWVWGYAALPGVPQGYLGENCQSNQAQTSQSYGSSGFGSYNVGEDYYRTYGGGISAGDGTYEVYNGATGSYDYE